MESILASAKRAPDIIHVRVSITHQGDVTVNAKKYSDLFYLAGNSDTIIMCEPGFKFMLSESCGLHKTTSTPGGSLELSLSMYDYVENEQQCIDVLRKKAIAVLDQRLAEAKKMHSIFIQNITSKMSLNAIAT